MNNHKKEEITINKIVKQLEKFEKEEIPKVMKEYYCKNCSTNSKNLEIGKLNSYLKEIKEFQQIIYEHNKNTNNTQSTKSDKWELAQWLDYIVIRKEKMTKGWLYSYKIPYRNKECYITCPSCKTVHIFQSKNTHQNQTSQKDVNVMINVITNGITNKFLKI